MRRIKVSQPDSQNYTLGWFHGWGTDFEEVDGGVGVYTTAIVELDNGTITTPPANFIQFTRLEENRSRTESEITGELENDLKIWFEKGKTQLPADTPDYWEYEINQKSNNSAYIHFAKVLVFGDPELRELIIDLLNNRKRRISYEKYI